MNLNLSVDPDSVESVLLETKVPMSREDLLTLVSKRVSITETIKTYIFKPNTEVMNLWILKCNSYILCIHTEYAKVKVVTTKPVFH